MDTKPPTQPQTAKARRRAVDPAPVDETGLAGFRRRLIVELAPAEAAMFEAQRGRYGSIKATVVAGLTALNHAPAKVDRAAEEAAALVAAEARVADLEARLAQLEAASGEAAAASKRQAKTQASADAKTARRVEALQEHLAIAEREVGAGRAERDRMSGVCEELEGLRVDRLYCGRCRGWAEPEEWEFAEAADGGGWLVYHEQCGLHQAGALSGGSIMGYRDDR